MSEQKKTASAETRNEQKGKKFGGMVFLTFGLLIVAAIAALAFVSNTVIAEQDGTDAASVQTSSGDTGTTENNTQASTETAENAQAQDAAQPKKVEIKDANADPVVAKLGDEDIKRSDVLMFIAQLPAQTRQQPIDQLFPLALEQTINARILEREAKKSNVASSEDVAQQVKEAKQTIDEQVKAEKAEIEKNIVRTAYVQQLLEKEITDEQIKSEYDQYVASFAAQEEVKARHILLETEDAAKAVIKKLEEGANFEELAKSESTGPSATQGGDLGYFIQGQMVPAFSDAAFAMEAGDYTKTPVQTDFGFHVIKVEDKRQTQPAPMEELKPFIEQELKRNVLGDKLQTWRNDLSIETYDINGDPVETSTNGNAAENAG